MLGASFGAIQAAIHLGVIDAMPHRPLWAALLCVIPLYTVYFGTGWLVASAFVRAVVNTIITRMRDLPVCTKCGYPRPSAPADPAAAFCPECGTFFDC